MTLALIARTWNWKSAVVSSLCRAAVFFATNLPAGLEAAVAAGKVELVYRLVAAGFYGGLTERFARWPSRRLGTIAALVLVPGLAHSVEYVLHRWAGTAIVGWSVLASVGFSLATTRFNLFAMRRGLLISGEGQRPLLEDLVQLGRMVVRSVVRSPVDVRR